MSQSTISYATRKRLSKIIKALLEGKNHDEIAEICGVKNRKTIERDLIAWRNSGGFEDFLNNEWLKLHGKIKKLDPHEAYRQITKLLGKTLTQKIKGEIEHSQIVVKMWKPEKDEDS